MDCKLLLEKLVKLQNMDLEIGVIKRELEFLSYESDAQKKEIETVLKTQTNERDALVKEINDPALITRVSRLQQRYRGMFLGPVVNSVCRACRMVVPAGLMVDLVHLEKVVYCESCGRILRKIEAEDLLVKPEAPPPAPKRGRKPKRTPVF